MGNAAWNSVNGDTGMIGMTFGNTQVAFRVSEGSETSGDGSNWNWVNGRIWDLG